MKHNTAQRPGDDGTFAVDETKRGTLAALGTGGRLAADCRSGELCEQRVTLGLIRGQ